ncbi:N-acyl-D-amino-acid deacylase family protein [Nesterenkonia cremea]|uniref:Dihydroorotase n=1 Tax=Nesterenkonia cremea TaxID=1882340 RepID=A0A917ER84_9MICC|nr:amidohydrolase family protein [Nesterenkonia cremea]GGE74771.1 dihydroorotase [Nesterenkonia cremea]
MITADAGRQSFGRGSASGRMLLRGAEILDGTGAAGYSADMRIRDGGIVEIGTRLARSEGEASIDLEGHQLLPTFIDVHSHDDAALFRPHAVDPKLSQGVTTTVVGNCGHGVAPSVGGAGLQEYSVPVLGPLPPQSFSRFTDYLDALDVMPLDIDALALVPHAPLRAHVIGPEARAADSREIQQMAGALDEALRAGAAGLSLGLMYVPGSAADDAELTALAQILARHGKLLVAHIRNEGGGLQASVDELLALGRRTGCPVHISHLKVTGRANFGTMPVIIERLDLARAQGTDVTADVYPYTAGSTTASTLLPSWVTERGTDSLLEVLSTSDLRRRALEEMRHPWSGPLENQYCSAGPGSILLAGFGRPEHAQLEGLVLADIAAAQSQEPAECLADLLLAEGGVLTIVIHQSCPEGLREALSWPFTFIGSDGLPREEGYVHPRLFGAFPKTLSEFARAEKLMAPEEAVRRMSTAPVARFGAGSSGLVVGAPADLQIIDPTAYRDSADYRSPRQETAGLDAVVMRGGRVWPAPEMGRSAGAGRLIRAAQSGRTL